MAYVITDTCMKDLLCVEACPTGSIHPQPGEAGFAETAQLFVDPEGCIDCGACVPPCTSDSIHAPDDLPEGKRHFAEQNAAYFGR
ncbi:MAG TPA: ferredoxin family protein [Terriglobales bacterium]|nr:ferredoxin family protein [Terriglobales bacterium]